MLEVGWTEMLVIAIVMIVVVGPKDLPKMLRTFGRTAAKLRQMAGDFQQQFNEALKEAELDDVKKSVDELRGLNPAAQIKKQLNPFEKAAADVRAGLSTLNPAPAKPASPEAQPAEPLKTGPAAMPGGELMTAAAPAPVAVAPAANTAARPKAAAKPAAKPRATPAKPDAAKPAAAKAAPAKAKPRTKA